ncbi:transposase [uncultured Lentibacter sp.]|uniref:REP-associated tyrosine transposase n=1 Tax=uncultured Lentibacter sp. TaxID=1659309 RepID=UPI002616A32B|nr:transposase [uncultured Lentibacter sp.]
MSNYMRPHVAGATIFFTVNLADRGAALLTERVDLLREAVLQTREERPFHIDAWVVLPDHIHAVWTLPSGDDDFSTRWGVIKARFSRQVPKGAQRASHILRRERAVWQRRFWEHHICGPQEYAKALSYCYMNPVKHGYVDAPQDWAFSSVHRDIRAGRWAA